jgi:hypothetical protein
MKKKLIFMAGMLVLALTFINAQSSDLLVLGDSVVTIEYLKEIKGKNSPYSNVSSPFFQWTVTFRETGGKAGFKVRDGRKYIRDKNGNYWVNSNNRQSQYDRITPGFDYVKPNGSGTDSSWLAGESFIGATVTIHWTVEDDFGNTEELIQEMELIE